jgi:hypothetical protein
MSLLEGYRLFTGYYVYESEIPADQKLEFVKFLKEASADDIIDVLSGEYEGISGLTEDEMIALNDYVEEKFGAQFLAKGAKAVKGAAVAGAGKVKGAAVAGAGKVKGAAVKGAGKVKGAAVAGAGKVKGAGKAAYGKTFHTAMGRTALAGAGGVAAGAGGVAAYKKGKKK